MQRPQTALLALTSCLVFAVSPAAAHDLVGGGCFLANFPDALYQQLMLESTRSPYTSHPSIQPVQGLHLALEGSDGVRATWMNPAPPSDPAKFNPLCLYGSEGSNLTHVASGHFYTYTAGMFNHSLNTAVLNISALPCSHQHGAAPCVKVMAYQCGDKAFGFSNVTLVHLHHKVAPVTPGAQFAIVGDMGVPHGFKTIDSIASRIKAGSAGTRAGNDSEEGVRMVLHAGDISYANHYHRETGNNSYVWVDYMNALQGVAASVPYMTAPGNHEAQFDFAAYLNWLPMPVAASGGNRSSPFWFSFDYLGVHVLSFSTEHDFSPNSTQHLWIQQDLKRANENRADVPWVVVMGHRPLYCSSLVCWERCHKEAVLYRNILEDILNQYRVDVVISGHNHQYERSYPVYKNMATQKNYTNPKAPVYIVNGAAGNPELNDPTFERNVNWRAADKASMATGFLLMTPSQSQLKFDYVMSDEDNVYDSFIIVRT